MKAKKALKKLGEVDQLLTTVKDKYVDKTNELDRLLDDVLASVLTAKSMLDGTSRTSGRKKPATTARGATKAKRGEKGTAAVA